LHNPQVQSDHTLYFAVKFIVLQTQRAVVCYPRFQLLPEVEENILGFVEQILLEAVSTIPSDIPGVILWC
jgi:hypothetical protein